MKADTVLNSGQVKCGSLYETTETDEGGDNSMNIYCDNFLNFVFFSTSLARLSVLFLNFYLSAPPMRTTIVSSTYFAFIIY